jgi:hypothetical protein
MRAPDRSLKAPVVPSIPELHPEAAANASSTRGPTEGERKQVTVLFADLQARWNCSPTAIPRRRARSSTPSSNE